MMMITQSRTGMRNVYGVRENGYRFGFNGMEKDDEVKGVGNSLDFGARIYDPRLGRWLSVDPLEAKYVSLSSYNFISNNPIIFIDPDGKKIRPADQKAKHQLEQAFNRVFGSTPEVLAHIKYQPIGTSNGSSIMGFVYNEESVDGIPKLSISAARKVIIGSDLDRRDKLIALSYLKAINQMDVVEVQQPHENDEGISPGVLTINNYLDAAVRNYNLEGQQGQVSNSTAKDATGSKNGESSFKFFNNQEPSVTIKNSLNQNLTIDGLININPGFNSSSLERIDNITNSILDYTGGASYSESGLSKKTTTVYSIDGSGKVNSIQRRK